MCQVIQSTMKVLSTKDLKFTISDLFSNAWKVFYENFPSILLVTLLISIPLHSIIEYFPISKIFPGHNPFRNILNFLQFSELLKLILGIISSIAITLIIGKSLEEKKPKIKLALILQKSIQLWPKVVLTDIILTILLIGLTLLFIIPGIIYLVFWIFALIAVILRNTWGKSALDYSKNLVKGRWIPVAGTLIVVGLVALFVISIIGGLGLLLPNDALTNVIHFTLSDIVFSYFTVLLVVFFLTLEKTQKRSILRRKKK